MVSRRWAGTPLCQVDLGRRIRALRHNLSEILKVSRRRFQPTHSLRHGSRCIQGPVCRVRVTGDEIYGELAGVTPAEKVLDPNRTPMQGIDVFDLLGRVSLAFLPRWDGKLTFANCF